MAGWTYERQIAHEANLHDMSVSAYLAYCSRYGRPDAEQLNRIRRQKMQGMLGSMAKIGVAELAGIGGKGRVGGEGQVDEQEPVRATA